MTGLFYDRTGAPIDTATYDQLLGDEDYKRIDATTVGPYWVSTVWLGINYGFMSDPPLIFETMVFPATEDAVDFHEVDACRYSTEAEARQGHQDMVTLLRATTPGVEQ